VDGQSTFGRSMKPLAPIPKSQVCPFQVFNKGSAAWVAKSARRRKGRSSTTRKYSPYCNVAGRAEAAASAAAFAVTESLAASSLASMSFAGA